MKIPKKNISNEELVEYFGSETNKKTFKKTHKLQPSTKKTILKKAEMLCDIVDLGGGQYQINEVYAEPKPASLRNLQSGLYQYMSPIILLKLLKGHDENNKVVFPLLDWAAYIDMINKNYVPMKFNQKSASEYLDINIATINEFFEKIDEKIRYYIENCLNYLKKADVLVWYKVPMVRKRHIKRVNMYNTDINLECSYSNSKATDEEMKYIISCSELVRTKLDIKSKAECFYGGKAEIYRKELSRLLLERDILYFYESYEVFYTNIDRCEKLLAEFDYTDEYDLVKNFNQTFIETMIDNAQIRQDKEITNKIVKKYRLDEGYVASFRTLSELTLDSDQTTSIQKHLKPEHNRNINTDFNFKIYDKKGEKLSEI